MFTVANNPIFASIATKNAYKYMTTETEVLSWQRKITKSTASRWRMPGTHASMHKTNRLKA